MGGVDLMDSFLGRYRIRINSRKWYIRIFYHLIDMAVINSWVLYKKANNGNQTKKMTLGDFRADLAEALCNYKKSVEKRGRPSSSNIERELEAKKPRRKPLNPVPVKDVRTDGVDHNERRCEKKIDADCLVVKDFRAPSAQNVLLLFAIPKKEIVLLHSTLRLDKPFNA